MAPAPLYTRTRLYNKDAIMMWTRDREPLVTRCPFRVCGEEESPFTFGPLLDVVHLFRPPCLGSEQG